MNILSDDGKSIVRLKSWDEVFSRQYFKRDVNPKKLKLKSILGDYHFGTADSCGLSSCKTKHKRGYLVQCSGFIETNIGHKCGKKYFGVEFEEQQANFTRDINARRYRENIAAKILDIPSVRDKIKSIRKNNGNQAFAIIRDLDNTTFKGAINTKLKKRALKGDGELVESTQATSREIDEAEARTGKNLSNKQKEALVTSSIIGRIAGIRAFDSYHKIKEILVIDMPKLLIDLEQLKPEEMTYHQLQTWSKRLNNINEQFILVDTIIDDCMRFAVDSNVRMIQQFQHLV